MQIQINIPQLEAARLFSANRDIRYYLCGVHVESINGETRLIATDGAACAIQIHPSDASDDCAEPFGIPNDACDDIIKRARDRRVDFVTLQTSGEKIEAVGLDMLFSKLDGKFPDYRRIVPATVSGEAGQFDPDLLARFAKASKKLSKGSLVWVDPNGESGAAAVRILGVGSFLGVLMPVHRKANSPALDAIQSFAARFR